MRHAAISTFTDARPFPRHATSPTTPFAAAITVVVRLLGLPGRVAAARRDMALLGSMSTSELADIGLARQDIRDAAALPLGTPPGMLLAQRAAERRRSALARRL